MQGSPIHAPITPIAANFPKPAGDEQAVKASLLLSKSMQVAAQIGSKELNASSFFNQLQSAKFVSRYAIPLGPQRYDRDRKERSNFIRGIKVEKPEAASDASEKPKQK